MESLVTFHCGQTIILGVEPSKTHAHLLLAASPASLLPLQPEGKVSVPPQPGRNDTQNTNCQLSRNRGEAWSSPSAGLCLRLDAETTDQPRSHTGMGNVKSHLAGRSNAAGCAVISWERSRFCLNTVNFHSSSLRLSLIPEAGPLLQKAVAAFPNTTLLFSSKGAKTSSLCPITFFHSVDHAVGHLLSHRRLSPPL